MLSQVNALLWLRPGIGIPSISTAYAQARRRCAQVIHMFVHRQSSWRSTTRSQLGDVGGCSKRRQARPVMSAGTCCSLGLPSISPCLTERLRQGGRHLAGSGSARQPPRMGGGCEARVIRC